MNYVNNNINIKIKNNFNTLKIIKNNNNYILIINEKEILNIFFIINI